MFPVFCLLFLLECMTCCVCFVWKFILSIVFILCVISVCPSRAHNWNTIYLIWFDLLCVFKSALYGHRDWLIKYLVSCGGTGIILIFFTLLSKSSMQLGLHWICVVHILLEKKFRQLWEILQKVLMKAYWR